MGLMNEPTMERIIQESVPENRSLSHMSLHLRCLTYMRDWALTTREPLVF